MNERELRTIRALSDSICALRDEIQSIRKDQQSANASRNADPVRPIPVEIESDPRIPIAIREHYEAENSYRKSKFSKFKTGAEMVGIASAVAIAFLTFGTFNEIQKQTIVAEQESRPWLKIVDVKLDTFAPNIPMLSFFSLQGVTMANLRLEFLVKNIGKGVANDVFITPAVVFAQWNDPTPDRITKEENRSCGYWLKYRFSGPFAWSAVFPGDEVKFRIAVAGVYRDDIISHIPGKPGNYLTGALYGCVTYQYPRGYQTRAVFDILRERDRFIEVGKDLTETQIRLIRDEHYERAQ